MQRGSHDGALSQDKSAKPVLRKGAWTHEEDLLLRRCIEKYGEGKWRQVPQKAGLMRCRKSCRLRWLNYLRPDLKRGQFAEDEVDLILRLHRLLGNKWALIAGRIPGRTANDIKNYWHAHLRKTLAARCSADTTMMDGGSSGAKGGKIVSQSTRAKRNDKDSTGADALPIVPSSPKRAAFTTSNATTFTVIRPQPRTLPASVRVAVVTPASGTRELPRSGGDYGFPVQVPGCSTSGDYGCPVQIPGSSTSGFHFPECSGSPTTPASVDDQIMTWWDGLLEGLDPSSDELVWSSSSEAGPHVEAIFPNGMFSSGDDEDEQQYSHLLSLANQ